MNRPVRRTMRAAAVAALLVALWARPAAAGFTETAPKYVFVIDSSYLQSSLNSAYNNSGQLGPLIPKIDRYEPGGGLQGTIVPNAQARIQIALQQISFGLLDNLTLQLAIPVVIQSTVQPELAWIQGDFQPALGRAYSAQDFWDWAGSMGQPKPGRWVGNQGALADMFAGLRWRFTDKITAFERAEVAMAFTFFSSIPTGRPADPEVPVSVGTTAWELHSQGNLGFHLGIDKTFRTALDNRLTIGLDIFYEPLWPLKLKVPSGSQNPLLLRHSPYAGSTFTLDPGDFSGASLQIDVVPVFGPALGTWIVKGDAEKAENLPPLLSMSFRYTFVYLGQSDWKSESPLWDWSWEQQWRPGYKNILWGQATVSLLRVGVPLQIYASYRNQTWIPGKNSRAVDVWGVGVRIPLKFW